MPYTWPTPGGSSGTWGSTLNANLTDMESRSVQAIGCLSFDRGGQAWVQDYGIVVSSGATYSYIQGVTKANNTAGLSSSAPTGSTITVVSDAGGK